MGYEHLGLIRWPFPVVPERGFCDFIADRKQLRGDIEGLLRTFSRQNASSIHLLWSWYGAGKTHTLFYLANKATQLSVHDRSRLYIVYSEFPKSARSFIDFYRAFVVNLDPDTMVEAYLEIYTSPHSKRLYQEMIAASPDLVTALQVAATGRPTDQVTALRWLRGEALPAAQFRKVGISQKIGSSEEGGRILASLVHLLGLASRSEGNLGCRVIWLLDEFQRIARLPPRVRDDINTGLHSTFNACPTAFSMVLSFSDDPQSSLPPWFSDELRDRIGRTKVLILPPLLPSEALEFVRDVLTHFRTPEAYDAQPYFPFTEETCRVIIDEVHQQGDELKPRAIMHAFNAVLQEADPKIEAKEMTLISPEFAKRVLAEHVSLKEAEESQG